MSTATLTEPTSNGAAAKLATVVKSKRGELKARSAADSNFRAEQDAKLGAIRIKASKADNAGMRDLLSLSFLCAEYAGDELAHGSKWRRSAKNVKSDPPGVVDQLSGALEESGVGTYFGASRLLALSGLFQLLGGDDAAEKILLGCRGHSCWKPLLTLVVRNAAATMDSNGREVASLEYQWKKNPTTKNPVGEGLTGFGPELAQEAGQGRLTYSSIASKVSKTMDRPSKGGAAAGKPDVDKVLSNLSEYWRKGKGNPEERFATLKELYTRFREMMQQIRDDRAEPKKAR